MPEKLSPDFKKEFKNRKELNIYGKEKFTPETAKEHVESLITDFKEYYSTLGYKEEPSVLISSGIDPTVRFVGSHISVFKPYLIEDKVPTTGLFMCQNCIRTRNTDKLFDDDYFPNLGSFFPSLGVIAPPERLSVVCHEAFDFLERRLGISPKNIRIRINSIDSDLMNACNEHYGDANFEVDTQKIEYYRHKLGIKNIRGRNFNIALRNPNKEGYSDVGNIILIEKAEKQLGVEVALGPTLILRQLCGLDHTLDCNPVVGLNIENETIRRKFEDAIITSTVLYREGLRPFGQHNRNRILKQYVRSLSYFRAKSGLSIEGLSHVVSDFEKREFSGSTVKTADIIIEYVKAFENELLTKKDLTEDEKKIKAVLESLT